MHEDTVPMPGTLLHYEGPCWNPAGGLERWPFSAGLVLGADDRGVWLADGSDRQRLVEHGDYREFLARYADRAFQPAPYLLDADGRAVFILSSGARLQVDRHAWWLGHPRAQEIAGCLNRIAEITAIVTDTPFDAAAAHALENLARERTWLAERRAELLPVPAAKSAGPGSDDDQLRLSA